jgi:hypothetical protein
MRTAFDIQPEAFAFEAEPGEFQAWQAEAPSRLQSAPNCGSADYIRWLQAALNQVLGLKLTVDGMMGAQARSAIRSFKQQQGLKVDGVIGPATDAAIKVALAKSGAGAGYGTASCSRLKCPAVLDNFQFDRDQVRPHHLPLIQSIAACIVTSLRARPGPMQVRLVGHTDPVGPDTYNLSGKPSRETVS